MRVNMIDVNDLVEVEKGNLYNVAFGLSKKTNLFFPENIFNGTSLELSDEKKIPMQDIPIHNLYLPLCKMSISYVIPPTHRMSCTQENVYTICFVYNNVKKYNETKKREFDIKFFMAVKTYDNLLKTTYVVHDKKRKKDIIESCALNDEMFLRLQQRTLFTKNIYYQIQKDPKSWSPKWFPIFDSKIASNPKKIKDGIEVGELTMLHSVGKVLRDHFFRNNVYSFRDENLFHYMPHWMHRSNERLLYINGFLNLKPQTSQFKVIDPSIEKDEKFQLVHEKFRQKKILYLDFEFVNNFVYLCGIRTFDGEEHVFWSSTVESELWIPLYEFLNERKDHIILYYHADRAKYIHLYNECKRESDILFVSNWIDLKYFITNYCEFRGSFTHSIKDIIKSISLAKLIQNPYDDIPCDNGFDSLLFYQKYLETRDAELKNQIIEYNLKDCLVQELVLKEIICL